MMDNTVKLSVVAPLFNEEEALPLFLRELSHDCHKLGKNYEIILVDDGSEDSTFSLIEAAAARDRRIKGVRFSRNFGHQAAFNAGIDLAQGDLVVTMDGDLQHPPSMIAEFIKLAEQGNDIVIGERISNRQNSILREVVGKVFYKILSKITGLKFRNVSDFALYRRSVVETLKRLPEKERYLRGMVQWVGYKKAYVPYKVEKRVAGRPKYTARKLFRLVLSGVTSFSGFPLRVAFWVGLVVFLFSTGFGVYLLASYYLVNSPPPAGFTTIALLVVFLGGIQLMVLGVLGEYLYKMFNEIKGRPPYIIAETINTGAVK